MKEIDKLVKKYKLDLQTFGEAQENYYKECNSVNNPHFNLARPHAVHDDFCDKLHQILSISAWESGVKESGNMFCSKPKEVIPQVVFEEEETGIIIGFSLFRGFNLTMKIADASNIKHLRDQFLLPLFHYHN
jgi:hypothetical protein